MQTVFNKMCSCLRQSFTLPKKLFISNLNSTSKSFSALSTLKDGHNSNYGTYNRLKNTSKPKQIQYRYFSLDNTNSFFESIRTSEACKLVTNALIGAHDVTGLSWTVTIIAATAVMKLLVTLPCGIYQQYLVARLEQTKVEVAGVAEKIKDETEMRAIKGKWTQSKFQAQLQKEVTQVWKALVVKNNCHPFKITILFLLQLPFWLLLTVSLRSLAMDAHSSNISQIGLYRIFKVMWHFTEYVLLNQIINFYTYTGKTNLIAENPVTALQFLVGGPFWCTNLSQPDPTLILPTVNALSILAITEVSLLSSTAPEAVQNYRVFLIATKLLPNFLRALAVAFFFISAASPAGISLFWTTSSLFSLGQNLLLMSPRVRRILRIPKTNSEVAKPYSYTYNNFIQKVLTFILPKK